MGISTGWGADEKHRTNPHFGLDVVAGQRHGLFIRNHPLQETEKSKALL